MYISQVRLRNIKGFHGAREVDLKLTAPGWTVIAGRNGSGKTSLLHAIALALGGPAVARNLVPDFENWVTAGRREAVAQVRFTRDEHAERWSGKGRRPSGEFWAGLVWTMPDDEPRGYRRGLQPSLREKLEGSRTAATRGPWQDNPTGWFCAAYGPFRRMVGATNDAQRLMSNSGPVSRLATLFHEDASLAEGVGWLIEQHLRSLERRQGAEELKTVALAVLSDGLLPDDYRIEGVDSDGLWVHNGDHRFPLREMSDGYRTVASLVVDLIKQLYESYGALRTEPTKAGGLALTAPGVVIIDEADAHLHVSWQKRIGGWLKEHFPNVQFIVTTHSPYLCQAADPGGLVRLPGPDQQEPPRVVDRALHERIVYGSGDDAVLSELFGLDTPYSERAERLRAELVALEVAVLGGTADARAVRRYEKLKRMLTSSPVARAHEVLTRIAREEP
ncbi:AAA family ATPase [Saccharothrix australiensis]|uniref:Putative ATP-binding protein involved in virulence n=1 Tax=Saccharothrix australiensis TaxID=2072 RepID=A0A495VW33_9PSEU|nr:AAA family ATPase [Saccharothrix australiensis]RKT53404.1 putative ATP-binding protein involved in virulence [Saccharothrix australiensis]